MPGQKRNCFDFQKAGKCRFGDRCRFQHDAPASSRATPIRRPANQSTPLSDSETAYRAWLKSIPREGHHTARLRGYEEFFAEAYRLLETDSALMQDVVAKLSTEGGLQRIKELLMEQRLDDPSEPMRKYVLEREILPFFKILSNTKVLNSLILEQQVGRLFNFIFGLNGDRAVPLFKFVSKTLCEYSATSEKVPELLEHTIVVFCKTFDHNTLASVQDKLTEPAKKIELFFLEVIDAHDEARLLTAAASLKRLLRHLQLGSAIPERVLERKIVTPMPESMRIQPPGGANPRHDNDFEDICNIKILPSITEIMSARSEYLPTKNPDHWHVGGVPGLLDRAFRLLREDTVGQLRDAIQRVMIRRPQDAKTNPALRQSIRTHTYAPIRVSQLALARPNGITIHVSFPQPAAAQKLTAKERVEWWSRSKRLQADALVCLINTGASPMFLTVVGSLQKGKDSNAGPSSKSNSNATATLSLVEQGDRDSIMQLMRIKSGSASSPNLALVEFPGVLLPAFAPTLKALQKIQNAGNLPFGEFLAPTVTSGPVDVPPAPYARLQGFSFNLRPVLNDDRDLLLHPGQPFDISSLLARSSLDEAQAQALVDSLTHCFSLIQGPPGTGKSYTGVAALKVLLKCKKDNSTRIGPIICICYTNHALDQLLEDILDSGATRNIVRIGSQSKSQKLQAHNLMELAKAEGVTRFEKQTLYETASRLEAHEKDASNLFKDLSSPSRGQVVTKYLQRYRANYYRELFGPDEEGFEKVAKNPDQTLRDWMKTGRLARHSAHQKSLAGLSDKERQAKYYSWYRYAYEKIEEELVDLSDEFQTEKSRRDLVRSECDLRCLCSADIIGATTSGLARKIDVLRQVKSKVMLCEEAGEVLEPHMLAALLPDIEHVILIGDHEQLRPQVQNFLELSRESSRGQTHCLDVSLFERLVRPNVENAIQLPYSTLEVQRRMHPSIAQLISRTLYPRLKDHDSVTSYPNISGLKRRLFWLDHHNVESDATDDGASHWNEFEIEMTAAIVTHLMHQGSYKSGEIAVLTPYLGQLHRLRRRLQSSFTVTVDERDEDELAQAGMTDPGESHATSKSTLLQALRVATVDNFQGEEAKVVVVSLVRCNPERRCGFLKTSNRINVLLSRAKHGMYIVGSSETASRVQMWSDVIELLRREGNIGPKLELHCERHPATEMLVSQPDDFSIMSPEGGCREPCIQRLACGHACKKPCHSALMHKVVYCLEPCQRRRPDCEHACQKFCGDVCPQRCPVRVIDRRRKLDCGHEAIDLACWQVQDLSLVKCMITVQKEVPTCLHTVNVPCYVDVSDMYRCEARCKSKLPCGHECRRACFACRVSDNIDHGNCMQVCDRRYTTCSHSCMSTCHGDQPCPPCQRPCSVRCAHSRCDKPCSEPCAPCAEELCPSFCPHSQCSLPCAAPCDHIPCSLRCPKMLPCGHQCPSVCGEICPNEKYCQICASAEVRSADADYVEGKQYSEVDLDVTPCIFPSCGHFLTIESMDGFMDVQKHYDMEERADVMIPVKVKTTSLPFSMSDLKTCPLCRRSLRELGRYGRLVRRAMLDEATKKLIVWSNKCYVELSEELPSILNQLKSIEDKKPPARIPEAKMLASERETHVRDLGFVLGAYDRAAWKAAKQFRARITEFRRHAQSSEQPFAKVRDAAVAVQRRTGRDVEFQFDGNVLQSKGFILASSLVLRFDLALLTTFFTLIKSHGRQLDVNWQAWMKDYEAFLALSNDSQRVSQQVEARGFLAQLLAVQRSQTSDPAENEQLRHAGIQHVAVGRELCTRNPGQTRGLDDELVSIENMLRESTFYSTVSNHERQEVIRAMAVEMRGTGHWYYCENGHPFTIGECGMPMEMATCPDCSAMVGGQNHASVTGNRRAEDLEESLRNLRV